MTRTQFRLASLAMFALFCVTATYWIITLNAAGSLPGGGAAASHTPVSVDAAGQLFGGRDTSHDNDIRLSGVLALANGGAAAIVSVGGAPAQAVGLGEHIGKDTALSAVRLRSIIIDRHGVKSELFLPSAGTGPTIYMR